MEEPVFKSRHSGSRVLAVRQLVMFYFFILVVCTTYTLLLNPEIWTSLSTPPSSSWFTHPINHCVYFALYISFHLYCVSSNVPLNYSWIMAASSEESWPPSGFSPIYHSHKIQATVLKCKPDLASFFSNILQKFSPMLQRWCFLIIVWGHVWLYLIDKKTQKDEVLE